MRRIVVVLTAVALAALFLFPPWRATWQDGGKEPQSMPIGHSWVFSPPRVFSNPFMKGKPGIRYLEELPIQPRQFDVWVDFSMLVPAGLGILALGVALITLVAAPPLVRKHRDDTQSGDSL